MSSDLFDLPDDYLQYVHDSIFSKLESIDGKTITIFGGTGFIGSWITATLLRAIKNGLNLKVNVVSRKLPDINFAEIKKYNKNLEFVLTDLASTIPKKLSDSDIILISSTPTSIRHGGTDFVNVMKASHNLIEFLETNFSVRDNFQKHIIHLSSGAVYKNREQLESPIKESEDLDYSSESIYTSAKIKIESALRRIESRNPSIKICNPRLFAFYGPGLPLDAHFAIGNFMSDAIKGNALSVNGSAETVRSYLHIADAAVAILKLICNPTNLSINLGSSKGITIENLAYQVSDLFNLPKPMFKNLDSKKSFYVPSILNLTNFVGDVEKIQFDKGLLDWNQWILNY